MSELVRLKLNTPDGNPIVHKYYRHADSAKGLVVTLPGNHYGVDGPLLYYPSEFLGNRGWDTLAITYGFQSRGEEFTPGIIADVLEECEYAIRACLNERQYKRISLLGKSLGALIVAQLCGSMGEVKDARAIYLTPPINSPFFGQIFLQTSQKAHMAMGTGDRFYSETELEELHSEREFTNTLIENADHSMDIAGDIEATMDGMKRLVSEVVDFIESE
jgi:predicted alpha/beta-fold hydrolase